MPIVEFISIFLVKKKSRIDRLNSILFTIVIYSLLRCQHKQRPTKEVIKTILHQTSIYQKVCQHFITKSWVKQKNPFPVGHKRPGVPKKEVIKTSLQQIFIHQNECQHYITGRYNKIIHFL